MNRYKKTLVVLVVLALLLGCGTAFGRVGLGNSFIRAFGMAPAGGGPAAGGPGGGGGGGTGGGGGGGTNPNLTTALWTATTTGAQQITPTFTPYTYGP